MKPEVSNDSALMDVKAAAAHLSVCERTILNLVARGALRPVYILRRRLFRRSDLERIAKHGAR